MLLTVFNTSLGILMLLFGLETKDYPRLVRALEELEYLHKNLEREVERQTALARQRELQVEKMSLDTVHALALSIDAKDEYTRGHSTRVAQYSRQLARALGWATQHVEQLSNAALLHDIGKIGVPDSILKKPGSLDEDEYAIIKNHTLWGSDILKNVSNIPDAKVVARSHHERWDGAGYPDGLAGLQIPLCARVVAIADAYDAMSSARVYREPLSRERIRSELLAGRGTQFDPELLDAFLPLFDSGALDKVVD
ncbi:MAG: HD-GYP domain-containing protein [Coriobacteriales bacterium]